MTTNIPAILPRLVYLHIGFSGSACAEQISDIKKAASFTLDLCESWVELFLKIAAHPRPSGILIHLNTLRDSPSSVAEISGMIATILTLVQVKCKIGIVIDSLLDYQFVEDLRKSNILNIVPGVEMFGQAESTKATKLLLAGQPYDMLKVVRADQKKLHVAIPIVLTPRQREISDLIKNRGISNKHIARQLSISESTVKLHIGAILKKYNLRNRTQLAVTLANTKAQID